MPENNNSGKGHLKGWCFIVLIFIAVLALWFFYPNWSYGYKNLFNNTELTEMGVFGDSYGALNTLFSALAFTGIIASIYFQKEELKATREELEATRNEMKNQGEQFEAQTTALKLQVFENTFFNMLKLHNDIVESMAIRTSNGGEIKGRHGFKRLCDEYYNFRYGSINVPGCIPGYEGFYINNEAALGHYFRVMYQLINLVENSMLSEEKKRNYIDILRAQLSTYELILLAVHSLSKHGSGNVKRYVERYCLLEHISIASLKNILGGEAYAREIVTSYGVSAYGDSSEEISKFFNPF